MGTKASGFKPGKANQTPVKGGIKSAKQTKTKPGNDGDADDMRGKKMPKNMPY